MMGEALSAHQARMAGECLLRARQQAGLGLRELARRAATSHATLSAYERGTKSPTMATFLRIIEACDFAVDLMFRPRIRRHAGLARGDELVEVLRLAEQFPARPTPLLEAPNYARLMKADHGRSGH